VFGRVALNYPVGGLNEYAVLETARQGGRIVWMPTINARHFTENSAGAPPMLAKAIPPGVSGLTATENARLLPAAGRVLDAIAEHGLTLATGHLHPGESLLVATEAARRGIRRVIVTHPHVPFVGMSTAVAAQLADTGAFIEVTDHEPVKDRVEMIRAVGAGRCFLSTDGGTVSGPPPATRLSSFIRPYSKRASPKPRSGTNIARSFTRDGITPLGGRESAAGGSPWVLSGWRSEGERRSHDYPADQHRPGARCPHRPGRLCQERRPVRGSAARPRAPAGRHAR
jgi:hypothetical protein